MEYFFDRFYLGEKGKTQAYGACLGLLRALRASYFEGQNDDWEIGLDGRGPYLSYPHRGNLGRVDVGWSDGWCDDEVDMREAERLARDHLEGMDRKLYSKLFNPTFEDMRKRHVLTIEEVEERELDDRLMDILGAYRSSSLSREGHKFHSGNYWMDKDKWRFVIAHNKKELAGIVGYYEKDKTIHLSYVSVAKTFRNNGLSKKMLLFVAQYARDNRKVLIRSKDSDYSKEVGADKSYSALFDRENVLHVISGSDMHNKVHKMMENGFDYDDMLGKINKTQNPPKEDSGVIKSKVKI